MTRKHQPARRPSAAATAAPQDHVVSPDDKYPATPIARWDANIRGLRIIKQLESEKRAATQAEQKELALYSGFGDSAYEAAFRPYGANEPAWQRRRTELEELLTPEELEGVKRSRLNAFYTTPEIVRSMWSTLSEMGADKLKNPKVLEPSAGSGRFLGLQPEEMAKRSSRMAVELDPMTADIVKHLYPETKVHSAGFQDAPVPDNHFDIAISNVPFGKLRVHDKEFAATGRKYLASSVHNYFFAKTLDKLRPGGVMAYITSHHTMDAPKAEPVRRYLADHADLVGAVRLPNDAFPDTQVVTDIIYLRKRAQGEPPGDDRWVKTGTVEVKDKYDYRPHVAPVNQYFLDNPDKVLGQHSGEGSMYGGAEYTVKSTPDKPLGRTLGRENAKIARAGSIAPVAMATEPPAKPKAAQPTRYEVVDGEVWNGDKKAELSKKDTERVRALVDMRDNVRRLVEQESKETDNEVVDATRESLRDSYDDYVEQYDEAINTQANRKLMGGDADDHLLFALEVYDKETECWQPSDIMRKRVVGAVPVQKASSAADAMAVVMNETGNVDFDRMGKMLGRSGAEVREELANDGLVFRSPDGVNWIPRAEYLSGNVREKLTVAQVAAKTDKSYEKHVKALEEAQPVPVKAEGIATPLGAPWIPADVVNEWVTEHLRPETSYRNLGAQEYFRYVPEGESFIGQDSSGKNKRIGSAGTGGWRLAHKINAPEAIMSNKWGTAEMSAKDILLKTLQGAPIQVRGKDAEGKSVIDQAGTIAAQEKAAAIQKSFEEWVWQNPDRRERLEGVYNDTHNANVPRVFDGSHQTFPGMALEWQKQMHPHQRDAIYRGVNDGTMLMAHEVGFGKSATMVATAKERKRLGLANKPVFVVPKATHEQFVGQFMELYPGAKLLAPDASDFTTGKRQDFLSRIATGDWDGVVLSSEQFEKIPISPETETKWISQQKQELAGALLDFDADSTESKRTQKQMQARIENYETRLKELADKMADRSDDTQYFETLGIDQIYVDEADRYKNLPYVTNMGAGRGGVKGLPQSESQRAWDMYMKIRHLQEKQGQKPDGSFAKGGVVFATGTPVANTIAETWTMMRYLQPDELKRRGLESFDAWAKTYGKITSGIEQTAAGKYRPVQRFSQFVNLPELSRLFQNVADIRVASEVPEMMAAQPHLVDRKGENKRETVVSPPHPALKGYMENLVKRAEALGKVPPEEDNMLKISSDARKASLDVRMVQPSAPYYPDGKVPMAAQHIAEIYHQEEKDKGTQLVFLDLGTPKAKEAKDDDAPGGDESLTREETDVLTNVYGTLRKELVAKGVPEDDVAFIHDYKTPAAREDLFDMVRSGDMRVLVGSTEKIGVGVNVQDRAAAAHHIDVPWRPRDVEQREGRIIRQGNKVYGPVIDKETKARLAPGRGVKIFQYVQEGSFDGFMWQAVETKARAIKSLMKRQQTSRGMDDIDPFILGVAEAKALASGNPLVKRAEEIKLKIASGLASHGAHKRASFDARTQKQRLELDIGQYRKWMPLMESDTQHVKNLPPKADFKATIEGKEFDKRTDAAAALEKALKGVKYDPNPTVEPLGDYKGFVVSGVNTDQGYQLVIAHPDTEQPYQTGYIEKDAVKAAGLMSRLDNMVKGIPDRTALIRERLEQGEDSLKLYEEQLSKQFEGAGELAHAERQLRVIQFQLSEDKKELRAGDDPELDVTAEYMPSADDIPREVPDADPIDLQEAVEAVRSPDQADTPEEVKEALEEELQSPDNASVSPDRTSVVPDSPQTDKATAEQVERIKALAEINPGRFADRLVRAASSMDRDDAPDAIEDLVDIIRSTENPQKIAALEALDKPQPVPQPDTILASPEPVVARSVASEDEEQATKETEPESPEPERESVAMATEPEPEQPEPESPEPEVAVDAPKPTSTEMIEAAKEGPVPLTGPESIMERLAEEKTRKREEAKARRATHGDVTRSADLFLAKLQADDAFQNALLNSDQQNAEIEYRQATKRAADELLAEDHTDVFRWFSDNIQFPGRLDMELRAKGVFKAAMPQEGEKVQTPDEVTALRREIRELGGSVPSGVPQEELQRIRDDLKEGGTAGRRVQVIGSPSKPEKKPDETPEPARETVDVSTEPEQPEPVKAPRGADRKMEFIKQHLEHGNDVMITTATRSSQITPRTWQSQEEAGKPILKASDDGRLKMLEGGKYVDASSARVSAVGSDPAEKTKRKRRPARRTAEPVAEAKSERKRKPATKGKRKPVVIGDTLYQGHWKSGIGHLKSEMPERRDGDGDTVVAERRPRKSDRFKKSPLPVPPKLAGKFARMAEAASKKRRRSRRNGGSRSLERNLKSPSRAPSIKVITR